MDGVTLRDVASCAGVSMGAVQRCFRTKDEMLLFAVRHVGERITERLRYGPRNLGALSHAATEIALLDDQHRAEARVWLAFVARATVSPALAEAVRRNYDALQTMIERMISESGVADPHDEACALLAMVDGLTTHVLIGRLSPDAAVTLLNSHLDRLATSR